MKSTLPTLPSDVTDPYTVLEIIKTATEKEIRCAYRRKARNIHPDKNLNDPKAEERFRRLQSVYEFLLHKKARKLYDEKVLIEEQRKARFAWFDESRKRFVEELEKREKDAQRCSQKNMQEYRHGTDKADTGSDSKVHDSNYLEKLRKDNQLWITKEKLAKQHKLQKTSSEGTSGSPVLNTNVSRGYLEVSWTPGHQSTASVPSISHETLSFLFSSFGIPRIVLYDVTLGKSIVELESREKNLEAGLHFLKNRHKYPFFVKFRKENIDRAVLNLNSESKESPNQSSQTDSAVAKDTSAVDLASFELFVMDRLRETVKRQKTGSSKVPS